MLLHGDTEGRAPAGTVFLQTALRVSGALDSSGQPCTRQSLFQLVCAWRGRPALTTSPSGHNTSKYTIYNVKINILQIKLISVHKLVESSHLSPRLFYIMFFSDTKEVPFSKALVWHHSTRD